ncbi:capsular polysaccharide synthesis enzyme [Corynebacterium maris DSM 45190]|uniref:Capsular polysaccharide synthesis enzyme n=1 Tax=Corynebacterium maris DSM 45190 TaxID=1224163 RepID=S5TKU7_9CORY|nr:NAD-dependent epimerase/dehydratase family protein [Corynebacterium maris]AGS35333.1 capsular polysaccharide synthesis enzyme [Corynebacterium maris DSM 45190]
MSQTLTLVGASGFLGWHVGLHARLQGHHVRTASARPGQEAELLTAVDGADTVIHLAACNRPAEGQTPQDAADHTLAAAHRTATALREAGSPPSRVVVAGTTQSGTDYGEAKSSGGDAIAAVADAVGATATEWLLPNLFGEHGRPRHNMVTATFIEALLDGDAPTVHGDTPLTLLAARHAAELLLSDAPAGRRAVTDDVAPLRHTTVPDLLARLQAIHGPYSERGQLPDLADGFTSELMAAYLSHSFLRRPAIPLVAHSDPRGSFFETVRVAGGGQTSFSTTVPGITRGDHLHLRKIERFVVLSGSARISIRRSGTDERVDLDATGEEPVAVDMPIGWSHNITNTGDDTLYTQFWISEMYDPADPDTFPEEV